MRVSQDASQRATFPAVMEGEESKSRTGRSRSPAQFFSRHSISGSRSRSRSGRTTERASFSFEPVSPGRHAGERTTSPTGLPDAGPTGTKRKQRPSSYHHHSSSGSGSGSSCAYRSGSGSSALTATTSTTSTTPTTTCTSDRKRLSGTVQHRGRHANDWLFGGFSLRDQVSKLWKDDGSPSAESELSPQNRFQPEARGSYDRGGR